MRERNPMEIMKTVLRNTIMRTALLALCTTAVSTIPMLAQDPPAPAAQQGMRGGRGGNQVEMLTKRLDLTPDQVTQVKAIDDDQMKQSAAVRNDSSLEQDARRSKMMDIRKASQDKIRAVLTDDQKTKYDALLEEMKNRQGQRGGGGGGAAAPPPEL
jgi:periplasmic protein CpxP/Spy